MMGVVGKQQSAWQGEQSETVTVTQQKVKVSSNSHHGNGKTGRVGCELGSPHHPGGSNAWSPASYFNYS